MKKRLKKQIAKILILTMVVFCAFPAFAEETVQEEIEVSVEEITQEAEAVEDEAILEETDVYAEECETLEVDEETTQEVVDTQEDAENCGELTENSGEENFVFSLQDILGEDEEPSEYGLYINGTPATADNAVYEIVPRYERENCDGTYRVSVDDNGNYYATLNNARMLGYGNNTGSCIYFYPEEDDATLTLVFDGENEFYSEVGTVYPCLVSGNGNVDIKTTNNSRIIETTRICFANIDGDVTVDARIDADNYSGINLFNVSGDLTVLGNSEFTVQLGKASAFYVVGNLTIDSASVALEGVGKRIIYVEDTITIENGAYVNVSGGYTDNNENENEAVVTAGTISITGGDVQVSCDNGFALSAYDSEVDGVLDISGDAKVQICSAINSVADVNFDIGAVYADKVFISSTGRVEFVGIECSAVILSELSIGSSDVNIFMTGYRDGENDDDEEPEDDEEMDYGTGAIDTIERIEPTITLAKDVMILGSNDKNASDMSITVPVEFVEYDWVGDFYTSYVKNRPARSILIKAVIQEAKKNPTHSAKEKVFTGTVDKPVSDGKWVYNEATGTWSYATSEKFVNTWAYIVNEYVKDGQNKASWFYFDREGNMLTGWQWITWNGVTKCYYLNHEHDGTYGACLLGLGYTPDGHEIDESGALVVNGEVQILHMSRS